MISAALAIFLATPGAAAADAPRQAPILDPRSPGYMKCQKQRMTGSTGTVIPSLSDPR